MSDHDGHTINVGPVVVCSCEAVPWAACPMHDKGPTGLCSAHRDGEDPTCRICYPGPTTDLLRRLADETEPEQSDESRTR